MHTYFHTTFGFCIWDLFALIAFVAVVAILVVHVIKQKKREKEFERQLDEKLHASKAESGSGK